MMVAIAVLAYLAVGVVVGLAFAIVGAPRLADPPAPVSTGARLLLMPGAALLWPLVVKRWLALRSPA
jgi:hypothetical protein